MIQDSKKENWIFVLKCIACIMITNSHCRNIYPVSFLAIGGGFGNSLFFIISGYLLVNIKDGFGKWIIKRYKRVLPITCIFILINETILKGINVSAGDAVGFCLYYVNKYWFVFAIMIYYLAYFVIFSGEKHRAWIAITVWLVGYVIWYLFFLDKTEFAVELGGASPFKMYFYFGIMIIGGILREYRERIQNIFQKKNCLRTICLIIVVISMLGWGTEYAIVTLFGLGLQIQFLIHLMVLFFAMFCVIFSWNIDFREMSFVPVVANSTLEIYLVQATFMSINNAFKFPVNWIVFWSVAFVGGIAIHLFVERKVIKR